MVSTTSLTAHVNANENKHSRKASGLELQNIVKIYKTPRRDVVAVSSSSLSIEPGEFVTLLGPSGCGKTTTLRMIAGFEDPSQGKILLDGEDIVRMPPSKRPMSMVFQSYALFPHLTVEKNIAFGLKVKKVTPNEITRRVTSAMEKMDLLEYAQRAPHELSGGQQQRVALARALVMEPQVLLFDEPLSNLDAKLRDSMRLEIRRIQQEFGITSIFVTHDQDEAMTMSDKIVVMSRGKIEQVGSPQEVYKHPRTRFVAEFLGSANFFDVDVLSVCGADEDFSQSSQSSQEESTSVSRVIAHVRLAGKEIDVPASSLVQSGEKATLMIRSEDATLADTENVPSSSVAVSGVVVSATFHGDSVQYSVKTKEQGKQVQETQSQEAQETQEHLLTVQVNSHTPVRKLGDHVQFVIDPRVSWVFGD